MRILAVTFLFLCLSVSGISAADQIFQGPAGYELVSNAPHADLRLWYAPASIKYYDDYIAVDTIIEGPSIRQLNPAARYLAVTWHIKPLEELRREARTTIYGADGIILSDDFNSPWRNMNDATRDSLGWQLYNKVMDTIVAAGIKPQPAPPYATSDMRPFTVGKRSYMCFDASSLKIANGCITVNTFLIYYDPQNGGKYSRQLMQLRLSDRTFRQAENIVFNEAGEMVDTRPSTDVWESIPPGSLGDSLLRALIDYCQVNNITLPNLD